MADVIDPTARPSLGGNVARSRWAAAGRHTRRQARHTGIMQEIASAVDQGESPFYLTPFGSHANTITDMVTQFAKDDEMTRLEKMCLDAFDTSDAVLDSIKELKGPLSDQMLLAHSDVADFLSARRTARNRLNMEIGMAARSAAEQPKDGEAKEEEEEEEEEEKAEGNQRDAMALLEEESSMGELKKATVFKGLVRVAAPPKSKTKALQPPGRGSPLQPKEARAKQGVLERLGLSEPTGSTVGSKEQPPSIADSEPTDVQSSGGSGGGQFTARSLAKEASQESLDRSSAATPPNRPSLQRREEERSAQQRALSPTRDLRTSAGGGLRFVRAGSSVLRPRAVMGSGTKRQPA